MGCVTPILRSFDEAATREFYVDFLGFKIDWEHRFSPTAPLYIQVSRGEIVLHLSEHYGSCSPGAAVRIEVDDIVGFHQEIDVKRFKYARPGLEDSPWNTREVTIRDPSYNTLIFFQPKT